MSSRTTVLALTLFFFCFPFASADTEIILKNTFIEKYKNRTSISSSFVVDKAHKKPNPAAKDGDLHVAGRAKEVELPVVAEIMNAAGEPDTVNVIHGAEGGGTPIKITGAWRIWTEHGGDSIQKQGAALQPFDTSNPEHVFEIHPVTSINGNSVGRSLKPIDGYEPKSAGAAFHRYENTQSVISRKGSTTTVRTKMAGYNYVEFLMQLNKDPWKVEDGHMAMASIYDTDGELQVRNRRMVFATDTPPDTAVTNLKKGDCLHVLGIPRLNLALVSWRASHAKDRPEVVTWSLPYEIIVVGIYQDDVCSRI